MVRNNRIKKNRNRKIHVFAKTRLERSTALRQVVTEKLIAYLRYENKTSHI